MSNGPAATTKATTKQNAMMKATAIGFCSIHSIKCVYVLIGPHTCYHLPFISFQTQQMFAFSLIRSSRLRESAYEVNVNIIKKNSARRQRRMPSPSQQQQIFYRCSYDSSDADIYVVAERDVHGSLLITAGELHCNKISSKNTNLRNITIWLVCKIRS